MKAMKVCLVCFCLCLGAFSAWGQGDVGDQECGLDFFNLGMSPTDAQKMGAKPVEENRMLAQFVWADAQWNTLLTFADNEVISVAMSTKDLSNPLVADILSSMEERTYMPFTLSRNDGTQDHNLFLPQAALTGKDESAISAMMDAELDAYAEQEEGSILVLFCGQDNFQAMVEEYKHSNDEEKAMATANDDIIYVLRLTKKDDMLNIVYSTLETLGNL